MARHRRAPFDFAQDERVLPFDVAQDERVSAFDFAQDKRVSEYRGSIRMSISLIAGIAVILLIVLIAIKQRLGPQQMKIEARRERDEGNNA